MFRALRAHREEVELYWCSIWYRNSHSVTVRCTWRSLSEWKIPDAASIEFKLLLMSM